MSINGSIAISMFNIQSLSKQRFLKLFSNLNYDLNFIKLNKNKGEIFLEPNDAFNYKIIISDYHDNQTIIHVPLVYDAAEPHIKENSKLDLKKIDNIFRVGISNFKM